MNTEQQEQQEQQERSWLEAPDMGIKFSRFKTAKHRRLVAVWKKDNGACGVDGADELGEQKADDNRPNGEGR